MTEQNSRSLSDNNQLDILADAISDVGYWSWWTEQLPDIFQIEFGGAQLYFPPASSDRPPQTQIALQFKNPTSVNFISRNETDDFKWLQDLHDDQMEPPTCSHGKFSFGNSDLTKSLFQQAAAFQTVFGRKPMNDSFAAEPISLIFWCGDIGLAIAAKEFKLLNHTGDVALTNIADLNRKWWDYWKTYWERRGSNEPLPWDQACEITIPLKS